MSEQKPPTWGHDEVGTGWSGPCWNCGKKIYNIGGFDEKTTPPDWYCWSCEEVERKRRYADFVLSLRGSLAETAELLRHYEPENAALKRAKVLGEADAWGFEQRLKEAGL